MSAAFARESSLSDNDSSVGEVLMDGAQRTSFRLKKVAMASACGAALVSVGFAAGKWRANSQVLRGDDLVSKYGSYQEFGEAFSRATAGKPWPEVHRIHESVLAGQGDLGAQYSALHPEQRSDFTADHAVPADRSVPYHHSARHFIAPPQQPQIAPPPGLSARAIQDWQIHPTEGLMTCTVGNTGVIPFGYKAKTARQLRATATLLGVATPTCTTKQCNFERNPLDRAACLVAECRSNTAGPFKAHHYYNSANGALTCETSVCDYVDNLADSNQCTLPKAKCKSATAQTPPLVPTTFGCRTGEVIATEGGAGLVRCAADSCANDVDALACCAPKALCSTYTGPKVCAVAANTYTPGGRCAKNECLATDFQGVTACCVAPAAPR